MIENNVSKIKKSVVLQIFEEKKNTPDKSPLIAAIYLFLLEKNSCFQNFVPENGTFGSFLNLAIFAKKQKQEITRSNEQIKLLNIISNWFKQENNNKTRIRNKKAINKHGFTSRWQCRQSMLVWVWSGDSVCFSYYFL